MNQITTLRRAQPRAALRQPVRALLLGGRLDTRAIDGAAPDATLSRLPLALRVGADGTAVLFRYGVIVLFNVPEHLEPGIIAQYVGRVGEPLALPESERAEILVAPDGEEQVEADGTIRLRDASPERLQIVAAILSKSVVLGYYEAKIADIFDRIEPLAANLESRGRTGSNARELLRQIGYVLKTQHRVVGRVEVEEKPEVLWDHPELERLYLRLEDEYELVERARAIDRKLALVHDTVGTLLELVQDKRSVRLEWYVIVLIVIEVLLSGYEAMRGALF
jgi:uncharacterized Rmd1/YagE family protein